jgi:hypothetical protein
MSLKYILLPLISLVFVACGGGGATSSTSSQTTDISIERGPVFGAYVVDSNGKRAYNISTNTYRFSSTPTYPIYSYGGYIDVNRDNTIDTNDAKINLPLVINNNTNLITIVTTLVQNSDIKNYLIKTFNLSEEELYTLTPSKSLTISAISDEVFKYCIENNTTIEDINITTIQAMQSSIQNIIDTNTTSTQSLIDIVIANETNLISDLNLSITSTELTEVTNTISSSTTEDKDATSIVNSYPLYELNQTQEDDLVYMYEEEKLARDVYKKMYELWGMKIFDNISKSEQTHIDAIGVLLTKYNLAYPSNSEGVFNNSSLQTMYNRLITSGNVSLQEALKVGVDIEEADISDLNSKILTSTEDIKSVYQNLLNGSYNHLNAFSKHIY